MGGVPDIIARAIDRTVNIYYGIIDPKLRQRASAPAEELYKVLGYLENYGLEGNTIGAILFYVADTRNAAHYEYHNSEGGRLYAAALNPAVPDMNHGSMSAIATALLSLLGIPSLGQDSHPPFEPTMAPEDYAHVQVRARTDELLALAATLPTEMLDAYRRRISVQLGADVWNYLSSNLQTMLATAEYVGFTLDRSADFSGPVLGLCASIELLVFDDLVDPVVAQHPDAARQCRTLGQALYCLEGALGGRHAAVAAMFQEHIDEASCDARALSQLLPRLKDVNTVYRVPAAHRALVAHDYWQDAWTLILGGEQALLPLLVNALAPSTAR